MEGIKLSADEIKFFHGIDRMLYLYLVRDLCRNPFECLQVMGLWLLLERGGFSNIISKILDLSASQINQLADEALVCLQCISCQFPALFEGADIPLTRMLTRSLAKTGISLRFFRENSLTLFHKVQGLVNDTYIPVLADIMETARLGGFNNCPTQHPMQVLGHSGSMAQSSFDGNLPYNLYSLNLGGGDTFTPSSCRPRRSETSRANRTMFATFSKGYPVTESEVIDFFMRIFGDCIESFHMQEVADDEQALYARVVFYEASIIQVILNGEPKAKFNINGKHVWMRQYVQRGGRQTHPCGCSSVGSSTCPHQQ